jgi:hypothetical protein
MGCGLLQMMLALASGLACGCCAHVEQRLFVVLCVCYAMLTSPMFGVAAAAAAG